jgi:hypothetical protein
MERPENESQRTNELLEKLLIADLRHQGIGVDQIAKYVGKRNQWVNNQLKILRPGRQRNDTTS